MALILLRKYWPFILSAAVLIACGLSLGWKLFSPPPPVQQVYHAAEQLAPNVVKAEVKPDANANPIVPLRKGEVLVRKITVTAQAKLPTVDITGGVTIETRVEQLVQQVKASAPAEEIQKAEAEIVAACQQAECPPVNVTIDLIRQEDGQQRAIVTSSDGEILGALDVPRENVTPPPAPKLWAAGVNYEPFKRTAGMWVDRDFDPHGWLGWLRVGAEVNQLREGSIRDMEGRAKIGVRF